MIPVTGSLAHREAGVHVGAQLAVGCEPVAGGEGRALGQRLRLPQGPEGVLAAAAPEASTAESMAAATQRCPLSLLVAKDANHPGLASIGPCNAGLEA